MGYTTHDTTHDSPRVPTGPYCQRP